MVGGSQQNFEQRVVGCQLVYLELVLQCPLLEVDLGLGSLKGKADEALACGGVVLFGRVDEEDVLLFRVDQFLDHDADVDWIGGWLRSEG